MEIFFKINLKKFGESNETGNKKNFTKEFNIINFQMKSVLLCVSERRFIGRIQADLTKAYYELL